MKNFNRILLKPSINLCKRNFARESEKAFNPPPPPPIAKWFIVARNLFSFTGLMGITYIITLPANDHGFFGPMGGDDDDDDDDDDDE